MKTKFSPKNHVGLISTLCLVLLIISKLPCMAQNVVPCTRLIFDNEVGCQVFIEEKYYMSVSEERGQCYKVCEGSTVDYTLEGAEGSTFSWQVIGGNVQNLSANNFSVAWGSVGSGQITVTETTTSGISETHSVCIEIIEQPQASFVVVPYGIGEDLFVCLEEEITFTDLSTYNESDILYWHWDFGDNTSSAERNPTHSWTEEGDYAVILTVTNECNCSNSFIIHVFARNGEPIVIECPSVVCENTQSVYSAQEGACEEYVWKVLGGTITDTPNQNQVEIQWDNAQDLIDGFGYLFLDNSFCPGTCGMFTTVKIPVITSTAKIKGEQYVCADEQYIYSLPEWPATLFNWDIRQVSGIVSFDSVGVLRGKDIVLTFSGEGTLRLSVSYFNTILGCGGAAELLIYVNPPTQIEWSETDFCEGDIETFHWKENGDPISGTWQLKKPNGNIEYYTGNSLTYTFNTVGDFLLSVEGDYCEPEPISFSVKKSPPSTGNIVGRNIICLGESVEYSAQNTIAGTIFEWEIDGGLLTNSTGETTTASWNTNVGSISLYRVNKEPPYCRTLVQTMDVQLFNSNNITITADPDNNYFANCEQAFYANYNGTVYSEAEDYKWNVQPNSVGSVVGNENTFNPTILLNNTASTLTNRVLRLELTKCGVDFSKTKTFNVYPVPAPQVTLSDNNVCSNANITFTITNAQLYENNKKYIVNGVEHSFQGTSFQYAFTNTSGVNQTYSVMIKAYKCDVLYTTLVTVTVKSAPNVSISPTGSIFFCIGETISVPFSAVSSGNVSSYRWYNANGMIPNAQSSTYTANTAGIYHVVVTGINECTASSGVSRIYQDSCYTPGPYTPSCTAALSLSKDCNAISATLTPNNFDNVNWHNTAGLTLVSQTSSTATYNASVSGNYYIGVTVSNINPPCVSYQRQNIIFPVVPACSVSYTCNSQNQYVAHFINTSSEMPNVNVAYSFIFDNVNMNTDSAIVAAGSTHILQIKSLCNNETCYSSPITFTVPTISAAFTIDRTPICEDNPITFTPTQTQGIEDYLWQFQENGELKKPIGVHNFQDPRHYMVSLTIEDKYGCSATMTDSVDVKTMSIDGEIVLTPNPAIVCEGSIVLLRFNPYANSYTPPISYLWSNGLGTSDSAIAVQTGSYTITVTDYYSCHAVFGPANVTVISTPQPEIMGKTNICVGDKIQLSGYYGQNYQYQWDQTAPTFIQRISTESQLVVQADLPGTYTYQLTVAPNLDTTCSTTVSVDVVVNPLPNIPHININFLSCMPYAIDLSVSPYYSSGTYRWNNGLNGESIVVNHGGPYCVYYTDANGCSVQTQDVSIPHSPEFYFWTFPKGCYSFCKEEFPLFVYGPVFFPINESWTWEWWQNMQSIAMGSSPSYSNLGLDPPLEINDEGTYQMLLNNGYCDNITEEMNVQMIDCKPCDFNIIVVKSCYDKASGTVIVEIDIDNPNGTDYNYSVQSISGFAVLPSSGTLSPGLNHLTFILLVGSPNQIPFTEMLSFIMWDPNDESFRCMEIIVKFEVFECDKGENTNKKGLESTKNGINSKGNIFYLYPNPTNNSFTIVYEFEKEEMHVIILRDNLGRELSKHTVFDISGKLAIDLSSYERGGYFVECRTNNRLTNVLKVVKN